MFSLNLVLLQGGAGAQNWTNMTGRFECVVIPSSDFPFSETYFMLWTSQRKLGKIRSEKREGNSEAEPSSSTVPGFYLIACTECF